MSIKEQSRKITSSLSQYKLGEAERKNSRRLYRSMECASTKERMASKLTSTLTKNASQFAAKLHKAKQASLDAQTKASELEEMEKELLERVAEQKRIQER
jgi:hypothetical protein